MWSTYRKEMKAYFISPIPYLVLIVFSAFMAWWFFFPGDRFFMMRQAAMDSFFRILPIVFIFLVPAISMRLWSEEFGDGTVETLLTLPVPTWKLVVGKFLAAWTLLLLCLLATLPIAITVSSLGNLDWGPVIGGYLGTLLMGGALLALGIWISALTGHQIVAFLLTTVAAFLLVVIDPRISGASGAIAQVFEHVSVSSRFEAMSRGVIDLRDALYFASFVVFFLYVNAIDVKNRRFK